jgi:TonB family protein
LWSKVAVSETQAEYQRSFQKTRAQPETGHGCVGELKRFSQSMRLAPLLLMVAAITLQAQEIAPSTPPILIHKVDPVYTSEAVAAKLQGTVILSFMVGTDGVASDIHVVRGLGKGLDQKAVECLQMFRFKPATSHGEPVSTRATVEIIFRLPQTDAAAFGQVQSAVVSGSATGNAAGQFSGSMSFSPMRFAPMPVQGAPYSGEEIQEQQQTLIDGTHINRTHMGRMMYRDSQGRTRVERPMVPMMVASNGGQAPKIVEITDPVQGVQYTLDTEHKIVHRVTLQPFPGRTNLSPQSAPANQSGRVGTLGATLPAPATVVAAGGGGVINPKFLRMKSV